MKLFRVPFALPAVLGSGMRERTLSAWGERREPGMTLPANCGRLPGAPPFGSKMLTP